MSDEKMGRRGWIGVDLDGTLAVYDGWKGVEHIGKPVPEMVERVRRWVTLGTEVRIFTARVSRGGGEVLIARQAIHKWCVDHIGFVLPVTCTKDYAMVELWDDRCVQVIPNTGRRADRVDA